MEHYINTMKTGPTLMIMLVQFPFTQPTRGVITREEGNQWFEFLQSLFGAKWTISSRLTRSPAAEFRCVTICGYDKLHGKHVPQQQTYVFF